MVTRLKSFSILFFSIFILMAFNLSAEEKIAKLPDDIGYMLEDMYGADKSKWPQVKVEKDLNNDGYPDWLIQNKCKDKKNCPVEIFLCVFDKTGKCKEYCYKNAKSLDDVDNAINAGKCESSC